MGDDDSVCGIDVPHPDGMALEDYLDKLESLTERIDGSGIELTPEKRSLLVMIMEFSKLHTHEAMAEVWTATGGMMIEKAVAMLRQKDKKDRDQYD
jgi:hypothetical protein